MKLQAPLRKIEYVIRHSEDIHERDKVRLECGHEVYAFGKNKARCRKCAAALGAEEKAP